jgi:hypothetical protein
MSKKPKMKKSTGKKNGDETAQANRERELRGLIEGVEKRLSESERPQNESPHDYVERRMRERTKKEG